MPTQRRPRREERPPPEPFATWLIEAGFTDSRFTSSDPRPSASRLGEVVGIHTTTLINMMYGVARTRQSTVDKVAEALNRSPREVAAAIGRVRELDDAWQPPPVSSLMSADQRRLVDSLIREFTRHAAERTVTGEAAERAAVEQAEGVSRMSAPKIRGELRALNRDREVLLAKKRMSADDRDELALIDTRIQRLEATLNPPQNAGGHAAESG